MEIFTLQEWPRGQMVKPYRTLEEAIAECRYQLIICSDSNSELMVQKNEDVLGEWLIKRQNQDKWYFCIRRWVI